MRPGDDKSIDRKMQFMPVVPPTVVSLCLVSVHINLFITQLVITQFVIT